MKKILTILLTLLMVFTLAGCNSESKEEHPVVDAIQEEVVKEPVEEEPEQLAGGWTDAVDSTITDELKDIFNKGLEGILGATYKPTKLLATQVVNGINYKFLAEGEKTTNPPVKGIYNITINKSSDGTISLLDIEVVEEELPEQKQTKDVTQMSFWVVFYDQYGNELQREALKYGSTPSYKKELPEGFEKWVYKKTQKDVGTLKAITGNTYYQAICHAVSHKSSNIKPTPDNVNYLYFKNIGAAQASITMVYPEAPDNTLEFVYSKDKINWNPVTIDVPLSIDEGERVFIRAKTSNPYMMKTVAEVGDKGVKFASNNVGALEVGGSIMTLLDPTDTLRDLSGKECCFKGLFYGMHIIKDATNLVAPATTLAPYCYDHMLANTDIVSVNPDLLPATGLSKCCYSRMFEDCYALINSPILTAKNLCVGCYYEMFKGCVNLSTIVMLATSIPTVEHYEPGCLEDWTKNVAEQGTFVMDTSLPIGTEGGQIPIDSDDGIPESWTYQDVDDAPLVYIATQFLSEDELYVYEYDSSQSKYVFKDDISQTTFHNNLPDFDVYSWLHKYSDSFYALCTHEHDELNPPHDVTLPQKYTVRIIFDGVERTQERTQQVEGVEYSCNVGDEFLCLDINGHTLYKTETECSGYTLDKLSLDGGVTKTDSIFGTLTQDTTITLYYKPND